VSDVGAFGVGANCEAIPGATKGGCGPRVINGVCGICCDCDTALLVVDDTMDEDDDIVIDDDGDKGLFVPI
jgi:hypothetical protein